MAENAYKRSLDESLDPGLPGKTSRDEEKAQARERLREGEEAAENEDQNYGAGDAKSLEDRAGAAINYLSKKSGKVGTAAKAAKLALKLKKMAPALVILVALVIVGGIIFASQSLMPFALVNQLIEKFNSVTVSPAERSNAFLNMQLSSGRGSSSYGETVYDGDEFKLTDYEKKALASAGIDYTEADDGTKSLVYTDSAGKKVSVVSDTTVSGVGAKIAASEISSDAMSEEDRILAAKSELLAKLDTDGVKTVSEALNDSAFKKKYTKGTQTWRGTVASWYGSSADDTYRRLGILNGRNSYSDWVSTDNYDEDYKKFVEKQKSDYENQGSVDADGTTTYDGLKAKAKEVAASASGDGCKAMSAIQETHSAVAAQQRYMQESAVSGYVESIQKTQVGEGSAAPLNIYNNRMTMPDKDGNTAMGAEGISWVFGSGNLAQDESVFAVSSEPNASTSSGTVQINDNAKSEYNRCNYVDSTSGQGVSGGVFNAIATAFNKIASTIKGWWAGVAGGGNDGSDEVLKEIDPALQKYSAMLDNNYYTDTVGSELGDATVQASEQIMSEVAKGEGMSIANEETVKAAYQKYQEVLADQAELDREERSPFDVTSPNTFLGSLVQRTLVPMAASVKSSSALTKIGSTISNLVRGSLTSISPTSSAADQAEFIASSVGNCPISGSTGNDETTFSVSNAYCNQYHATDMTTINDDVLSNFEKVASLRYDNRATVVTYTAWQDEEGKWHVPSGAHNSSMSGYYWINTNADSNPAGEKFSNDIDADFNPDGRKLTDNPFAPGGNGKLPTASLTCASRIIQYVNFEGEVIQIDPLEWSYSTPTNFKHVGYNNGYPTNEFASSTDPGSVTASGCTLDMKIDNKNPDINVNSALGEYIVMSGQRVSNWGVLDADLAEMAAGTDIKHGTYRQPTEDEIKAAGSSEAYAARISGSAFSATHDKSKASNKIFMAQDGGTGLAWEYENQYYQRYVEDQALMEGIKMLNKSGVSLAVEDYRKTNPLDNSYEGIIARYSGQSKETVVAVFDLLHYADYIAKYDPMDLYPLPVQKAGPWDFLESTPKDGSPESGVIALEKVRIQYAPSRNRYKTTTL